MATTKKSVKTSEQKVEKVDVTNVNKKGDETMNEQLNLGIEGNSEAKKGDKAMNTFNIFEFGKTQLITAYLNADKANEFDLKVKYINDLDFTDKNTNNPVHIDGMGKVLGYLAKNKAFTYKIVEQLEVVNDELKTVYTVKIKDFDITAKAKSKAGKDFMLFKGALGRVLENRFIQEATA